MIDNLTEAIQHCKEKSKELKEQAGFETDNLRYMMSDSERADCLECATEYEQIASWLTELRDIRKVVKDWQDGKIDDDMPMHKAFSRIIKIIEKSED